MDIPDKILKNRKRILTTPTERNICNKKYFYNEGKCKISKIRALNKKYKNFDHVGYSR